MSHRVIYRWNKTKSNVNALNWNEVFNFDFLTHFDFLSIDVDGFHWEIDADGVAMPLFILTRLEPLNDARFSRPTISNQYNFE